jgi:hypothetical protein
MNKDDWIPNHATPIYIHSNCSPAYCVNYNTEKMYEVGKMARQSMHKVKRVGYLFTKVVKSKNMITDTIYIFENQFSCLFVKHERGMY